MGESRSVMDVFLRAGVARPMVDNRPALRHRRRRPCLWWLSWGVSPAINGRPRRRFHKKRPLSARGAFQERLSRAPQGPRAPPPHRHPPPVRHPVATPRHLLSATLHRQMHGDFRTGTRAALCVAMRRNPFDLFAKDCLELLLEDAGRVERSREVSPPAQLIDATFTPTPQGLARLRRRGLLGRLAQRPCAWECFHDAPSLDDLRLLVRKHLGWHALLTARGRRKDRNATVPLPALYVVCAARPTAALDALPTAAVPEHGDGFYAVSMALVGMCLIVVAELPKTRDTLSLRVLGRDEVLDEALAEIAALPPGRWERRIGQAMIEFAKRRRTDEWSDEMEKLSERIKKAEKRLEEQGRAEGRAESLAQVVEARLGRALKPTERATLRAKVSTLGPARVARLVVHRDPDALGAWLAGH